MAAWDAHTVITRTVAKDDKAVVIPTGSRGDPFSLLSEGTQRVLQRVKKRRHTGELVSADDELTQRTVCTQRRFVVVSKRNHSMRRRGLQRRHHCGTRGVHIHATALHTQPH